MSESLIDLERPRRERPPTLPQFTRRLTLRAHLDIHSGYGLSIRHTFTQFQKQGIFVTLRPLGTNEMFGQSLPPEMRSQIMQVPQPEPYELLFAPPTNIPTPSRKTVYYSMWESSQLSPMLVRQLNAAEAVIVPCEWCAKSFRDSGVKKPIYVNPLGVDPAVFAPAPLPSFSGPLIFGVAGRVAHCPKRKGVQEAIDLFLRAFPGMPNVRLHVKIHPDDVLAPVTDPRIKIFRDVWEPYQLAHWLHGIHALITLCRAEGYGLWPLQALACGRPVIGCAYSGQADFMTDANSFLVPFREVLADGVGANGAGYEGDWAEPDIKAALNILQSIARRPQQLVDKATAAAPSVASLTWQNFANGLLDILENKVGIWKA